MKFTFRSKFSLAILLTSTVVTTSMSTVKIDEESTTNDGFVWIMMDCTNADPDHPLPIQGLNEPQITIYEEFLPFFCEEGTDIICAAQYEFTTDFGDPWTPVIKTTNGEFIFNPFFFGGRQSALVSYIDDEKCSW